MHKPTALITGVNRRAGIGAGIARVLAASGWNLILTHWLAYDERMPWGTQPQDAELILDELQLLGASVTNLSSDFARLESPSEIFQAITALSTPVSALVLCHCESVASSILDTTVESFERHFAVNCRASWQLIKHFAEQVPSGGSSIVALTSDAAVQNLPYGSSKGALDRIVLAAARELAHLHIRSNVINPGPIDNGWIDEEIRKKILERQPNGLLGTPQDIGNLVAFLLSPAGTHVNGQLIKCDGGFSAPD
jgi:3-oxoacyl-[acyl-carrier protein] reductase